MNIEYINKDIAWHYFKQASTITDRKKLFELFNQIPTVKVKAKILTNKDNKNEH